MLKLSDNDMIMAMLNSASNGSLVCCQLILLKPLPPVMIIFFQDVKYMCQSIIGGSNFTVANPTQDFGPYGHTLERQPAPLAAMNAFFAHQHSVVTFRTTKSRSWRFAATWQFRGNLSIYSKYNYIKQDQKLQSPTQPFVMGSLLWTLCNISRLSTNSVGQIQKKIQRWWTECAKNLNRCGLKHVVVVGVTHAGIAAGVGIAFTCVCLSICLFVRALTGKVDLSYLADDCLWRPFVSSLVIRFIAVPVRSSTGRGFGTPYQLTCDKATLSDNLNGV